MVYTGMKNKAEINLEIWKPGDSQPNKTGPEYEILVIRLRYSGPLKEGVNKRNVSRE